MQAAIKAANECIGVAAQRRLKHCLERHEVPAVDAAIAAHVVVPRKEGHKRWAGQQRIANGLMIPCHVSLAGCTCTNKRHPNLLRSLDPFVIQ